MPTTDEIKQDIRSVINSLINDDEDKANEHFHNVLQAKMQERINPKPEVDTPPQE